MNTNTKSLTPAELSYLTRLLKQIGVEVLKIRIEFKKPPVMWVKATPMCTLTFEGHKYAEGVDTYGKYSIFVSNDIAGIQIKWMTRQPLKQATIHYIH